MFCRSGERANYSVRKEEDGQRFAEGSLRKIEIPLQQSLHDLLVQRFAAVRSTGTANSIAFHAAMYRTSIYAKLPCGPRNIPGANLEDGF